MYIITFLFCINAFSQDKVTYTYNPKDSTLVIGGKGEIKYFDVNKFKDKCVKVEIKEGIEGIQFFSFSNFKFMKEIKFPNTLRTIGKHTFCYCASLDSVVIPPEVRLLIGSFNNCDNLKSIAFPDTIGIEMRCFNNCRSLKKLSFKYLSNFANYCNLENCVALESVEVSDSTSRYKTYDGILFTTGRVIIYPYAKKNKSCKFYDTIKEIAMLNNPYIEEIYVSDGIEKILLGSCKNLKLIKSENKVFYDKRNGDLKIDTLVIQEIKKI